MIGLVEGPGADPPPDAGEFSKICNKILEIANTHYFSLFFIKISKLCVKFLRVWTKNTTGWESYEKILEIVDENSIEKLNFYLFMGKLVAKNRAFGNNIIFLQQFFPGSWGGGVESPPPLRKPLQG